LGVGNGARKENPPGLNSAAEAFNLDPNPPLFEEEGRREWVIIGALGTPLKEKPESLSLRVPNTNGFALGLRFGFGG
jgi:hypothetical protein